MGRAAEESVLTTSDRCFRCLIPVGDGAHRGLLFIPGAGSTALLYRSLYTMVVTGGRRPRCRVNPQPMPPHVAVDRCRSGRAVSDCLPCEEPERVCPLWCARAIRNPPWRSP